MNAPLASTLVRRRVRQTLVVAATLSALSACSDNAQATAATAGSSDTVAPASVPRVRIVPPAELPAELVIEKDKLEGGFVADRDPADVESLDSYPYLATSGLRCVVEVPAGSTALSYSWDGGFSIPVSSPKKRLEISYGELGASQHTRLYAPFNGDLPPTQPGFDVKSKSITFSPGRMGEALHIKKLASSVSYKNTNGSIFEGPWTLECWWYPDADKATRRLSMLEAPGLFQMWAGKSGNVMAQFFGDEGFRMKSIGLLRWGEWNHVALTYDPELGFLRFVLNDTVRAKKVEDERLNQPVKELLVGRGSSSAALTGRVDELRVEGVAADTREMLERYLLLASPGEHRLKIELDTGEHEFSVWAGVHTEPEIVGREEWARGALSFFDPRANGLQWCSATWSRDDPKNPPMARTTQPVLYVGNHEAFVFSGETKDSYANGMHNTQDTWIYHIDRAEWELIETENPPGRCHQAAAYSPDHDVVLMHGGWRNANGEEPYVFSDTWLFHVQERRWEKRVFEGTQIGNASDCGVVYNSEERLFYLFQWRRIWTYDPETDEVGKIEDFNIGGENPPTDEEFFIPGSPVCEYDPDRNRALFFGGVDYSDDNDYVNMTLEYDFESRTFLFIAPDVSPTPRARGAMTYDTLRKRFVMFGGVLDQSSNRKRDLWVYDMDAHQWEEIEDAATPSRRGGYYKMAYDPELDVFALLCGRASRKRFLNEAWRLKMDSDARASATYVFDRAGFPDRDRVIVEGARGADELMHVEIFSSDDGVQWGGGDELDRAARFIKVSIAADANEDPVHIDRVRFVRSSKDLDEPWGATVVVDLAPMG